MKNLIRRILLENENQNPLTNSEVMLFKFINGKKKDFKKKSELISFISDTLKYMGLDKNLAMYYYNLYTLNFREKGDYENLTKSEFSGVENIKSKKITNVNASGYTVAKMPFKGSNLEGYWDTDPNGEEYYVILSYGWYPIFLFKNGIWFENVNRYSSATGRQMRNANPIKNNWELKQEVYMLTTDDMKKLMRGQSLEQVLQNKTDKLISDKSSLLVNRALYAKGWNPMENHGYTTFKVKYKMTDIRKTDNGAVIDVLIYDAGPLLDGITMTPTQGGYLRGENRLNKEIVENLVKQKISSNLEQYIGHNEKSNIIFNFKHEYER
jgi:hypothetical protein